MAKKTKTVTRKPNPAMKAGSPVPGRAKGKPAAAVVGKKAKTSASKPPMSPGPKGRAVTYEMDGKERAAIAAANKPAKKAKKKANVRRPVATKKKPAK